MRILFLALAALWTLPAAAGEIPVEHFAALPVIQQPSVSPDGSKIAAMVRNEAGYYDIMVTPFDKVDFIKVASLVKAYDRIDWIRWANDERLLVSASKPANISRFKIRVSKLYSIDVNTGESLRLYYRDPAWTDIDAAKREALRDESDLVSILRDDPEHVLIQLWTKEDTGPAVFKVNVYKNTFEKIVNNDFHVIDWYANVDGEVLFGVGINEDDRRNGRSYRLWMRDNVGSEWKMLREIELGVDESFDALVGSLDGDSILVFSDHAIRRVGLYRFNVRSGEFEDLLYANDTYDLEGAIMVDGKVVGVDWYEDYLEQHYFDPADAKLSDLVKQTFKGAPVHIASIDRARKKLVVAAVSDNLPVKYYLLDLENSKASFWFGQYPQLEGVALPEKMPFNYTARDGMKLHGYLTLPLNSEGKPPLVVLPHGGPAARDKRYFDPWAQLLAAELPWLRRVRERL